MDFETGMMGSIGGSESLSPRICGRRKKPVVGSLCIWYRPRVIKFDTIYSYLFFECRKRGGIFQGGVEYSNGYFGICCAFSKYPASALFPTGQ